MSRLKIVIADDHPIARAGLKLVLDSSDDFLVVGEAISGQQAVDLCQSLLPDVLLMDVSMPQIDGVEAVPIVHRRSPSTVVILISAFRHEELQRQALRAGAAGYISKETEFPKMLELIRAIVRGATETPQTTTNAFNLTTMEMKMLYFLAEGKERQAIAEQMGISINTVKMHFRNLYQKLGVENAADALKSAIQHHLLS